MIGYKAAYDYKCLNQRYSVGETYKINCLPIICEKGFHYCKDIEKIFIYYSMGWKTNVFEIEDLNYEQTASEYSEKAYLDLSWKYATNHIKIIRELSDFEIVDKIKSYHVISKDTNNNKILTYCTINGFWITKVFDEKNSCEYYADSFGRIGKINISKINGQKFYVPATDPSIYAYVDVYDSNKLIRLNHKRDHFNHIQKEMFELYNIRLDE